jgi:hypothetical protein
MSVNLRRLHGVLKDKTRTRILELLEQNELLGYSELQDQLGISHTGTLNYHLKVLGDLLAKDGPSGKYSLSDKGKIAASLLHKFETATSPSIKVKSLVVGMLVVGTTVAILGYLAGSISLEVLGWSILGTVTLSVALYSASTVWEKRARLAYPIVYGLFFGGILFFSVNFLLYNVVALPRFVQMDAGYRELVTMPPSYLIAGYFGYWLGKRRGFAPPTTI